MALHPLAGQPAPAKSLINVAELERDYRENQPDPSDPQQLVSFGTSGHRGTSNNATFTETHILAITQAICDYRRQHGISGPLFMGKDTHALSGPAQRTALEVLAANDVTTFIQRDDGFTPTPALSLAILDYNRRRQDGFADGVGITPSHNPPSDGGFKYNSPNGGPADTDVTSWIQRRANELLPHANRNVPRLPFDRAFRAASTRQHDFCTPYVEALGTVLDLDAIRSAGVRIGVDPLGGASVGYWEPIKARYGLHLTVVNQRVDPTFGFMTVDHDGKIRMDCSSKYAMASLERQKDQFDVAFGCDPDADRHGIVSPTVGLMNPNHYLAVAINYLLRNRQQWPAKAKIGKTVVSSSLIDRVVANLRRELCEVPVGFKYFVKGLHDGSLCFGGEESAGACFLRRDGSTWVTEKDGLLLGLLAAEIRAVTKQAPGDLYLALAAQFGTSSYARNDTPCTLAEKASFKKLTAASVTEKELASETISAKLVNAPGNDEPIGGLKVVTANGWFAARPSGTESLYKLYAESFRSQAHLDAIQAEAKVLLTRILSSP
jgi:phosphoglucomutase